MKIKESLIISSVALSLMAVPAMAHNHDATEDAAEEAADAAADAAEEAADAAADAAGEAADAAEETADAAADAAEEAADAAADAAEEAADAAANAAGAVAITPIADLEYEAVVTIAGIVSRIVDEDTIIIEDETGDIRVDLGATRIDLTVGEAVTVSGVVDRDFMVRLDIYASQLTRADGTVITITQE